MLSSTSMSWSTCLFSHPMGCIPFHSEEMNRGVEWLLPSLPIAGEVVLRHYRSAHRRIMVSKGHVSFPAVARLSNSITRVTFHMAVHPSS